MAELYDNIQQNIRQLQQNVVKSGIIREIVTLSSYAGEWAKVDIDGEIYIIPAKPNMKVGDKVILAGGENFF